jgi:hypothetical protein
LSPQRFDIGAEFVEGDAGRVRDETGGREPGGCLAGEDTGDVAVRTIGETGEATKVARAE